MKNKLEKLKLNKETLKKLTSEQLHQVNGASLGLNSRVCVTQSVHTVGQCQTYRCL
jgi:hypothetical protein